MRLIFFVTVVLLTGFLVSNAQDPNRFKDEVNQLYNKEYNFMREFIEYVDLIGLLYDFIEFKKLDFIEKRDNNLHKFLKFVSKELNEDFSLKEYNNDHKLFFNDIQYENLWVDFRKPGLSCILVYGSGKKWRSSQFCNYIKDKRGKFNDILFKLHSSIPKGCKMSLIINSIFHLSRFRSSWLGGIRGEFTYPDKFDQFCDTFTNYSINTYQWIDKKFINNVFQNEIKENRPEPDSKGLFPKWEDKDSFLQYCYCDIVISIPQNELLKERDELLDFFRNILSPIKDAMMSIDNSLSN